MLFVFAAPSGSGKTSIVREILKLYPQMLFSVSATTREKRYNEVDGRDYYFISKQDFLNKIKNNELVEYELIYDNNYYGTLRSKVDEALKEKKSMAFDVDVKGALSIKKIYGDKSILIFVLPPHKDIVRKRLIDRGTESIEEIDLRMKRFDFEMAKKTEFDYVVKNENLSDAIQEVNKIIKKYIKE